MNPKHIAEAADAAAFLVSCAAALTSASTDEPADTYSEHRLAHTALLGAAHLLAITLQHLIYPLPEAPATPE